MSSDSLSPRFGSSQEYPSIIDIITFHPRLSNIFAVGAARSLRYMSRSCLIRSRVVGWLSVGVAEGPYSYSLSFVVIRFFSYSMQFDTIR